MVITIGGMIGTGKSSLAKLVGERLGTEVFYESVEDNPILPLFYTASDEEIEKKRYPFLLQLYFLDSRFKAIKKALANNNNVLDRSIYEDWYFAKVNKDLGRISEMEFQIYESLLNNMMEELQELPKKAPDIFIYLKGSFAKVLERICCRGREYELDEGLKAYYYKLWEGYDDWVYTQYDKSLVLTINIDEVNYVGNEIDKEEILDWIQGWVEA